MSNVWIVGIHGEAAFSVVAIAQSKEEAIKIAKALRDLGAGAYIWEAEKVTA